MKITLINKSDSTGGAAVVSTRLMNALREAGADAKMIVTEKLTDSPYVAEAAGKRRMSLPFVAERLGIFAHLRGRRSNLFKVDTGACGLPLWRHPWVREADVVCLNWVNQGMLSLRGVERIAALRKPVVWTMHDMWCATGICHHAADCRRFTESCGECPLLAPNCSGGDLSHRVWLAKRKLNSTARIDYVAVSNWLADKASESSLLSDAPVHVIPNAFPIPSPCDRADEDPTTVKIIMGAARLDDPIKGLPVLVKATRLLAAHSSERPRFELITYGRLKDPMALDGVAIPHTHLGVLNGEKEIRDAYRQAHIVISTSSYETLPGTLVEGQAYGCVPVSFDSGGQRDIIDDGVTGVLARYSADIDTAADSIAAAVFRAAEMVCATTRAAMRRSVIEKFSAQTVANAYITLFEKLIRKN